MSNVTLVETQDLVENRANDYYTRDSVVRDVVSPQARLKQTLLEHKLGPLVIYHSDDIYFPETANVSSNARKTYETAFDYWVAQLNSPKIVKSIWDTDKFKMMLSQPLGTPVEMTRDEAEEIIRLAAGRKPELPSGKTFVREIREQLGHSISKRLEKSESNNG